MKLFIVGLILGCTLSAVFTEETRLLELEPDEAAQVINQQDQSLRYAPKVDSNVPAVRVLGNHPEQVVEDIYLANQYHGQDGLGAYVYGYSAPDISKTEKKERSGDLKGAYNYIAEDGQEIKVEYWDDGTGFHQIDNVARIQPKQVEDSPEVQAAKDEFLRIWHEQAERNLHAPPDPYAGQYDQPEQNQYQPYQQQPNQNQGAYQGAQDGRYQQTQPQQPPVPNHNSVEYSGQYSANQQTYARAPSGPESSATVNSQGLVASANQYSPNQQRPYGPGATKQQQEEEENNGPPKGFFYAFDYPVGIIVGKEGKNLEAYYNQNKNLYEKQLQGNAPISSGPSSYHASA